MMTTTTTTTTTTKAEQRMHVLARHLTSGSCRDDKTKAKTTTNAASPSTAEAAAYTALVCGAGSSH
jgi:hypothetical protein